MRIRKAGRGEIEKIDAVYSQARRFMRDNGNPYQWGDNYPSLDVIENDIERGRLYTLLDDDDSLLAVFVFYIGIEEAYNSIDGSWSYDGEYAVLHRIASTGRRKGTAEFIFNWILERKNYLRVDTYMDNSVMRHVLVKYGFRYCGTVYYTRNGVKSPRLAFDIRRD